MNEKNDAIVPFEPLRSPRAIKPEAGYKTLDWESMDVRAKGNISEVYLLENNRKETFPSVRNRVMSRWDSEDPWEKGFQLYKSDTLLRIVDFACKWKKEMGWNEGAPSSPEVKTIPYPLLRKPQEIKAYEYSRLDYELLGVRSIGSISEVYLISAGDEVWLKLCIRTVPHWNVPRDRLEYGFDIYEPDTLFKIIKFALKWKDRLGWEGKLDDAENSFEEARFRK